LPPGCAVSALAVPGVMHILGVIQNGDVPLPRILGDSRRQESADGSGPVWTARQCLVCSEVRVPKSNQENRTHG
jgi:hypothetical protein